MKFKSPGRRKSVGGLFELQKEGCASPQGAISADGLHACRTMAHWCDFGFELILAARLGGGSASRIILGCHTYLTLPPHWFRPDSSSHASNIQTCSPKLVNVVAACWLGVEVPKMLGTPHW